MYSDIDETASRFRNQMPVTERYAYFDHAAVAPIPLPAREAMARWLDEASSSGDVHWPRWAGAVIELRATAARLLDAAEDEIAMVRSTSHGIGLVAEGFPWREGDNVVTLADEFPSNVYPWLNLADRGVETRLLPLPDGRFELERLLDACDGRTRVVSVSWVNYLNGRRIELAPLADALHERGILLLVDAIQGMGAFPLSVKETGIDFLAADGHKWMLGPEGAGIFYCRREHLDLLRPTGVGWHSVVHAHDFDRLEWVPKPSAERFEGGSPNIVGMIGLGAALHMLDQLRLPHIAEAVLQATELACQALERVGAVIHSDRTRRQASGIVLFEVLGTDPQRVKAICAERDVILSCRGGRLRISPHGYCTQEDIDRLAEALKLAKQEAG